MFDPKIFEICAILSEITHDLPAGRPNLSEHESNKNESNKNPSLMKAES